MRNRLGRLVGAVVMMVGAVAAVGVGVVASTGSSAAATPEPSSVTVLGDSDTWLLHGQPSIYTAPNDTIAWQVDPQGTDPHHLRVTATGGDAGDGSHTLNFATPGPLAPGHYAGATRYDFQPSATPRMDISTQTRGCNESSGEFTIHDIAADRLWLTYVHYCDDELPVFGEVRIGLPDDGPLQVTARSIAWPAAWPSETAAPTAPVELVNTGNVPLGVATADVLAGGSDFTVRHNTCTSTLAPGARCRVTIGFVPSRPGVRRGSLRITDTTGAVTDVALGGSGRSGRTFWNLDSDDGDWVGDGGTYAYSPATGASFLGEVSATEAHLLLEQGTGWWRADFEAPQGQTLVAGTTYAGALKYDENGTAAGLDVAGLQRACAALTGSFTVHEVGHNEPGRTVSGLRISFEQHCDSGVPALRGELAMGAADPAPATPDTTAPAPAGSVAVGTADADPTVSWTNPGDADWADTVVTVLTAGQSGARTVYAGRATSVLVTGLDPTQDSTVVVRTRDTSGNLGSVRSVAVPASGSPSVTPTVASVSVTPSVTPTVTPSVSPTVTATAPTSSTPTVAASPTSTPSTTSTAPPPGLVAPDVAVTVGRQLERDRRVFKVAVAPGTPGERVVLQRRVAGVWSTIDRTALGPRGRARLVAAVPDGRSLWRAKVRATDDHLAATSPRIRLRTG